MAEYALYGLLAANVVLMVFQGRLIVRLINRLAEIQQAK